jgi:hypothetical protein
MSPVSSDVFSPSFAEDLVHAVDAGIAGDGVAFHPRLEVALRQPGHVEAGGHATAPAGGAACSPPPARASRPRRQSVADELDPQMLDVVERGPEQMRDLVRRDSVPAADLLDLEHARGDELRGLGVVLERGPGHPLSRMIGLFALNGPAYLSTQSFFSLSCVSGVSLPGSGEHSADHRVVSEVGRREALLRRSERERLRHVRDDVVAHQPGDAGAVEVVDRSGGSSVLLPSWFAYS